MKFIILIVCSILFMGCKNERVSLDGSQWKTFDGKRTLSFSDKEVFEDGISGTYHFKGKLVTIKLSAESAGPFVGELIMLFAGSYLNQVGTIKMGKNEFGDQTEIISLKNNNDNNDITDYYLTNI